jgi:hypothetical protein
MEDSTKDRVQYALARRIHRINRMEAAGLMTPGQADQLLDEIDVVGSSAWVKHYGFAADVQARIERTGRV